MERNNNVQNPGKRKPKLIKCLILVTIGPLMVNPSPQFGKYGALNYSRESQLERLKEILVLEHNLTQQEQQSVYSIVEHLYSTDRLESLRAVIPDVVERYEDFHISTIKDRVYFPKFAVKSLGLNSVESKSRYIKVYNYPFQEKMSEDIKGLIPLLG